MIRTFNSPKFPIWAHADSTYPFAWLLDLRRHGLNLQIHWPIAQIEPPWSLAQRLTGLAHWSFRDPSEYFNVSATYPVNLLLHPLNIEQLLFSPWTALMVNRTAIDHVPQAIDSPALDQYLLVNYHALPAHPTAPYQHQSIS